MTTSWTQVNKASGTSYTDVAKPTTFTGTTPAGSPIGLLLALTYAGAINVGDIWTDVSKAVGTLYTNVTKAT